MRGKVRTGWIVVGGTFTALVVLVEALAVWANIRAPRAYDFAYPAGYDSAEVGHSWTTEITTYAYTLESPLLIVDLEGRIGLTFVHGVPGRIGIRRVLDYADVDHDFSESWENGKVLRAGLSCERDRQCRSNYTLSVPDEVGVLLVTPDGSMSCEPGDDACRAELSIKMPPTAPSPPTP